MLPNIDIGDKRHLNLLWQSDQQPLDPGQVVEPKERNETEIWSCDAKVCLVSMTGKHSKTLERFTWNRRLQLNSQVFIVGRWNVHVSTYIVLPSRSIRSRIFDLFSGTLQHLSYGDMNLISMHHYLQGHMEANMLEQKRWTCIVGLQKSMNSGADLESDCFFFTSACLKSLQTFKLV